MFKLAKVGVLAVAAAAGAAVMMSAPTVQAGNIQVGTYRLFNHPDGNQQPPRYGLRLDELFNVTTGNDEFTFDFEAAGTAMYMDFDGTSIHIYGRAYGGLDTGTGYTNPNFASFVTIDFTYSIVSGVPGDDDLWATTAQGTATGSIEWEDTGQVFNLSGKADGNDMLFRFGDEDDNNGHRGHNGLSGWGWLMHPNGTGNASDWLFTAVLIPLPGPAAMAATGMLGVIVLPRRRRRDE